MLTLRATIVVNEFHCAAPRRVGWVIYRCGARVQLARCVVADPPWPYESAKEYHGVLAKGDKVFRKDGTPSIHVGAEGHYETLSIRQLCALPVRQITERDAHLYLWTTNAFMVEAHEVARAWGFEPKTIITWGKTKHDDPEEPSMKTGYYFRGATEHVVFAVRGSLKTRATLSTLFLHPRINRHSEKPERFYTEVVERASFGPYVELFARRRRPGWSAWGNQLQEAA